MLKRYNLLEIPCQTTPLDPKIKLVKSGIAEKTDLFPPPEVDTPDPDPDFKRLYQSKVGALNFAAMTTRPDLAFAVGYVARYSARPTQDHMDAVDHIFGYIKTLLQFRMVYKPATEKALFGYVDSDFAGCVDTSKLTTGWIFLYGGNIISWKSKRQTLTTTSTTEAEYVALHSAAKEAMYLRNLINDLKVEGAPKIGCVHIYIDNNAANDIAQSVSNANRLKHLKISYRFVKEQIQNSLIRLLCIDSAENVADMLTKPLDATTLDYLRKKSGMVWGSSGRA